MQLKKLEQAVGRPVLTRGPRHLALTPTGRELLSYARRLLELHAQALTALNGPTLRGHVSLGVPDDYAIAYLTPVLRTTTATKARSQSSCRSELCIAGLHSSVNRMSILQSIRFTRSRGGLHSGDP
jgi:hypothetical protein